MPELDIYDVINWCDQTGYLLLEPQEVKSLETVRKALIRASIDWKLSEQELRETMLDAAEALGELGF